MRQIDRTMPLARTDIHKLAEVEYSPAQLELAGYRARLVAESAERRMSRGKKKGARRAEIEAVVEGKRLLRVGIDVAYRALATRTPSAGEPGAEAARKQLLADIERTLASLPTLSETKKGLQADAKSDTAALDEIDGRAVWNLKQLCSAGRTYFRRQGDFARAAE